MADKDHVNAFIGDGVTYEGDLTFQGTIRIDGRFTGRIISDGKLVLGQHGIIKGDVMVAEYIANGHMEGRLRATASVILMNHACLRGQVFTPVLVVEEGATIDGAITMGQPETFPDWDFATAPGLTTAAGTASALAAAAPPDATDAHAPALEAVSAPAALAAPGEEAAPAAPGSPLGAGGPEHADAPEEELEACDDPPLASTWHASRRF